MLKIISFIDLVNLVGGVDVWRAVSIIIAIICLCIIGYYYKPKEDGPLIIAEVLSVALLATFWPIFALIAIACGIVSLPIFLGMYAKKLKSRNDKKKKEEFEKLSNAEKILKDKGL